MHSGIRKVKLNETFAAFTEHWSPRIIAQVNDVHVKVAKLHGDFPWHAHDAEDELFLVVKGRLKLEFRDGEVWLGEGELAVVPRGTEHRPIADEEVHIVLIEPAGTLNTGNVRNERTIDELEWL
jgi:mannose-6-phosphate isomerase-like protein (cupin superfamily)